mmetsp:Transcript_7689/g.9215  ORF Transcript_7689/g.9215 Transcript_7689/m.9215 type:complete len:449 (+) Transcript_7689:420-1766(+)
MKTSNLLIQSLGENVDMSSFVFSRILFLPKFKLSQGLVGEGGRHDETGMTSSTSQVKKTSFGENNDTSARLEDELVDLGFDVDAFGDLHETVHINFVIKVTNVTNDGIVLHLGHGVGHKNTLVTSGGDEDIGKADNFFESGDSVSLHTGLKSTDGINFRDVNDTSIGTHGGSTSLTNITVSADNSLLTGHHDIGGTHDTIGKRMLASVQVVKLGLGDRVIDIDGREKKSSSLLHGVQTVNTGGGFLGNTLTTGSNLVPLVSFTSFQKTLDDGQDNLEFGIVGGGRIRKSFVGQKGIFGLLTFVDEKSHIPTIIDNDVTSVTLAIIFRPGQGIQGALPVFLKRFTLPGKDGSRFVTGNGGSGVILGRENVTRTPTDITTQSLQGFDEDSGLDSHVQRSRNTSILQRSIGTEFFTACHQARHLHFGKFNVLATVIGQRNISDFVISSRHD